MTAQIAETLIYQGQDRAMHTLPLSTYFALGGERPQFRSRTTFCWRGYMGEWTVLDDRLYLTGLKGWLADESEASLSTVFPGFGDRVFAHWFSGTVRLPQGELLAAPRGGFYGVYAEATVLTFRSGVLVDARVQEGGRPKASKVRWKFRPLDHAVNAYILGLTTLAVGGGWVGAARGVPLWLAIPGAIAFWFGGAFLFRALVAPLLSKAEARADAKAKAASEEPFAPRRRDLVRPMTLEQIELEETVRDPLHGAPEAPFGHLNPVWRRFVEAAPEEAEFWRYAALVPDVAGGERREGYACIRQGKVVACFDTARFSPGS